MIGFVLLLLLPLFVISETISDYDPYNRRLECYTCDGARYEAECQTKLKCLLEQVWGTR